MALRAQGIPIRLVGREARVLRATAQKWEHGYWQYRGTEKSQWIPPLDRLEVRPVSPRYLSRDERLEDLTWCDRFPLEVRVEENSLGTAVSVIVTPGLTVRRGAMGEQVGGSMDRQFWGV